MSACQKNPVLNLIIISFLLNSQNRSEYERRVRAQAKAMSSQE